MQPHIRRLRRAGGHVHDLPRLRRHPAQRARPGRRRSTARTSPTLCAMQISDLADWVRGLDGAVGRAAARRALQHLLDSFVEIGLGYLSLDRPGRHAVGRRGPAHQDDPAPRVVAHRRHLRLRRADDRPAPARHRADERAAAPAARQGQHRAGRRAQAGDDRDRRPRRRPRPGRRRRRRHDLLRGHRRGAARERHRSPAGTSTTAPRLKDDGAHADRRAGGPRRQHAQPAGRRRRHPARRARASSPASPGRARAR